MNNKWVLFWDDRFNELRPVILKLFTVLSYLILILPLILFTISVMNEVPNDIEASIIVSLGGFWVLIGFFLNWLFWKLVTFFLRLKN